MEIRINSVNKYLVTASVSSVIVMWVIMILISNQTISIQGVSNVHNLHPLLYVIDIALLLGGPLLAFFYKRIYNSMVRKFTKEADAHIETLQRNILFTQKLINNQLDFDYKAESEDQLGDSLIQLRKRLQQNRDDEANRKTEDEQRRWSTEGQARFAEILRQNNNNNNSLNMLAYSIISNLIKYLQANQGGFYFVHEATDKTHKPWFELLACYAYERQRIKQQRIEWGEGLIGRCAIERQSIYMTDVPHDYIKITSGLGNETPTCVIIVPLITNDELEGVIEIATFKPFEQYQIDFIEKIAGIVASTLAGVKINIQTAQLLEESQLQSTKMARQEEEMRHNMEELRQIQKEAAKQSEEFISFSNSVNHTMIRADYDVNGNLIYANTKFLKKLGYDGNMEVEGRNISTFIHEKDKESFTKMWESLSHGGRHYEGFMKHITKDGKDLWTLSTYTCVKDEIGAVSKVLFLAIDTTESKKQSLSYEGLISALDRSSLKAEYAIGGEVTDCNTNFLTALDYGKDEITHKSIFDLADISEAKNLRKIWGNILRNIPYDGRIRYVTKDGREKWLFGSYTTVKDMYGDVEKIVFVGNDTTEQVRFEQQVEIQNQKLKEQESKLHLNQVELEHKLVEAKKEMSSQFQQIEKLQILNEKTLEGALDAIVTFDSKGTIYFFNKAAEKLWNYSRTEVLEHSVSMLFSDETCQTDEFVQDMISPSSRTRVGVRQEVKILTSTKDENNVLVLLSDAEYESTHTYTAFIQTIEVELF